jgi:multiple sugar transport system permease protein
LSPRGGRGLCLELALRAAGGLINQVLKALGLPMQQFLRNPDLALPSITVVAVWRTIGFAIIIFLAGLQQIPDIYYEAAQIDGANRWQMFWRITLPLLNPVIVYLAVLQTIEFLRMFDLVQNMTQGGPAQPHDDRGAGGLQRGLLQLQHGLCRGADRDPLRRDPGHHGLQLRVLSRRVEY